MLKASDDAWQYWDAMQTVRAEGARFTVSAQTALRKCSTKITGDGISYYDRCALPWLGISTADVGSGLITAFPQKYFEYLQRYLKAARDHQPSKTGSGIARVFWALDVWAHIQYGLMALNIPYGEPTFRFQRMRRSYKPNTPINGKLPPLEPFNRNIKNYKDALPWLAEQPPNGARFGAFQENITGWCDTAVGSLVPSQVWQLLLTAVLPWSSSWASHWLQSKALKDKVELETADEVYSYALMQWRLWSVQDWDNFKRPSSQSADWPRGMGSRFNCSTLTDYVKYISYNESHEPEIVLHDGYAQPNFAWCFLKDLPAQIAAFVSTDYKTILRQWWSFWIELEGPHFTADATALDTNQTQPITQNDYADVDAGMSKAAMERAAAAQRDPRLWCSKDDRACQTAAVAAMHAQATANKSPIAWMQGASQAIANFLATKFGFATSGQIPFFVLGPPFARTYETPMYNTAPDGSSADVFIKITTALVNISSLTGLDITTPLPAAPVSSSTPRDPSCHVIDDPQLGMIEVCATPSTGISLPSTVSGWQNLIDEIAVVKKACERSFGAWVQQNATKVVIPPDAQEHFIKLCGWVRVGKMTQPEADAAWANFIADSQPSLWRAFIHGFIGAGSPRYPLGS